MTKPHSKIHKEIEKKKHMKQMKTKANYKKIGSSSLKTIYNKIEAKQHDAIKKRRTVKKNKNIFLNKKKTIKKDKTINLRTGGALFGITFGRNKEKKLINNYKANSDNIRNSLFKYTEEFKKMFGLYKNQQKKLNDNYIQKFNNEINAFLDGIIDQNLSVDVIDKKSKSAYKIMKTRMVMLNKIYRFSSAVGQKMRSITTFNINRPKNFYYKSRHSRGIRYLKLKDESKIKRKFAVGDNLWGTVAVYREYEIKLEKIKSEIKTLLIKHEKETKNIKMDITRLIKNRFKKIKKEYKGTNEEENINTVTKEELDKLKELKTMLKPIYDEYNKNLDTDIHYYIPKIKVTNMNLILMDMPKINKNTIGFAWLSKSNIEYDEAIEDDTSKKDIVSMHEAGNKALFDKSVSLIDIYFNAANDILSNDFSKYLTNYIKLHEIQRLFHNIGILYLYNLEKKPYIDIGQISMLSYENSIEASLTDIKKSDKLIYSNNMDYYNNILHLPRFVLNHLKVCMLKSAEETYDDDFYKLVNISDKNALDNIEDKKIKEILKTTGINKFKSDKLGLKLDHEKKTLKSEIESLEDDSGKIDLNSITSDSSFAGGGNDKPFFLPISTYHAMFKIRDFSSIKNIKFKTDFFKSSSNPLYKSTVKINNKDIENGDAISKLFYINKNEDVLPGTIIYLYKQIAYLLHFVLKKSSSNKNLLYENFLEKILNFSLSVKTSGKENNREKNIKRNIGIFTGVDNRKIYITYVMIVYIQHLNRLLECVTDLEYLTEKLFHTYKKDTEARKIFREEINRISKQEDYSVSKEKVDDKKEYGYSDLLSDNEINEDIKKSSYEYKKLMYKIKKEIDSLKSLSEINDLIQIIVENKKSGNVKPRISLLDYFEITREGEKKGDKFVPENNIYELYLANSSTRANDIGYFKSLIESIYLNPTSSEVGGHDNELLKDILNIKQDKQPEKINSIQTELYYLILLVMDKKKIPIMEKMRKLEAKDKDIKDNIRHYLEENIEHEKGITLVDIHKNNDITIENKMRLMNKFNLLHKDNFMFFTNKMYKDKRLVLSSLLALLPTYNKEYIHTSKFKEMIENCERLLTDMEKTDAEIKTKLITRIKEEIGSGNFLLVDYKHEGTPNIDFNTQREPLSQDQTAFIDEWKETKKLPKNKEGENILIKPNSTITAIEKEGLNEEKLDKIPEIILGHNTFKEKVIPGHKKSDFETLFKEKQKNIELFNKQIMLISLFKILIDKLLISDDKEKEKGEHKSVKDTDNFHERGDVFYPIQFIFLDSEKPYEEEKYNYLQYSQKDVNTKESNKIDTILKEIHEKIEEDFETKLIEEDKKGSTISSGINLEGKQGLEWATNLTTFKKNAKERYNNIKNNILDNIKDEDIFTDFVEKKNDIKKLEKEIEKYEEAKTQDEKKRLEDSIAEIKVSLNKFFKLKLKLKDNKDIKEYIMDPKVPSNDFSKIIDGYKIISISLDEKGLYSNGTSIDNYFYSFMKLDKKENLKSNDEINDSHEIILEDNDNKGLIEGLSELYKKNIKIVSNEIVNWSNRESTKIEKFYKDNDLNTKLKVNNIILITINKYLNNDEYIKRRECETKGGEFCKDKDIANQTIIPYFISELKQKSVSEFLEDNNVIFKSFKNKISVATDNFKEQELGQNFNNNIERLLVRILTKIKENFILVNRNTLEGGLKRF